MDTRESSHVWKESGRIPASVRVFAVGVALAVICWTSVPIDNQVLVLGIEVSVLGGWLLYEQKHVRHMLSNQISANRQICKVDGRTNPLDPFTRIATYLDLMAQMPEPLMRECVLSKMATLDEDMCQLSAGRIVFANTETWRATYEKVLRAPGVTEYRSVAWVKTADYWQDRPGQQSIRLNYDLLDRGVSIERIVILGWNLWVPEIHFPGNSIRRWLEEQHYRGISLSLVRETDLVSEPDLLCDFGIYGTRATGEQELDEQSRTVRFELRFDEPGIRLATDHWERLKLYARPYNELLDQTAIDD